MSMLACVCDQSLMNRIKCHNGPDLSYSFTQRKMGACKKGTVQVILGPSYHSGDHSNTMLGRWRLIQICHKFRCRWWERWLTSMQPARVTKVNTLRGHSNISSRRCCNKTYERRTKPTWTIASAHSLGHRKDWRIVKDERMGHSPKKTL